MVGLVGFVKGSLAEFIADAAAASCTGSPPVPAAALIAAIRFCP